MVAVAMIGQWLHGPAGTETTAREIASRGDLWAPVGTGAATTMTGSRH